MRDILTAIVSPFAIVALIFILREVKAVRRPADSELSLKSWKTFCDFNLRWLDWLWRGSVRTIALIFVSIFTGLFLISLGHVLGIMTPAAEGEITQLVVVGAAFPALVFTWQEVSSMWR